MEGGESSQPGDGFGHVALSDTDSFVDDSPSPPTCTSWLKHCWIPTSSYGIYAVESTRIAFRVRNITDRVYAAFSDPGYQDQIYLGAPRTYEIATSFRW